MTTPWQISQQQAYQDYAAYMSSAATPNGSGVRRSIEERYQMVGQSPQLVAELLQRVAAGQYYIDAFVEVTRPKSWKEATSSPGERLGVVDPWSAL